MPDFELRKAFGVRLRFLRKQHHWTLKELAAKIDVQPSQLNKYECGVNLPPGETLVLIAAIFHTTVDFLLLGSPSDNVPLHNHRLLERFRALEQFPADDRETVIKVVDALIFKLTVQGVLKSFDNSADNPLNSTKAPNSANSASTSLSQSSKNSSPKIKKAANAAKSVKSSLPSKTNKAS